MQIVKGRELQISVVYENEQRVTKNHNSGRKENVFSFDRKFIYCTLMFSFKKAFFLSIHESEFRIDLMLEYEQN